MTCWSCSPGSPFESALYGPLCYAETYWTKQMLWKTCPKLPQDGRSPLVGCLYYFVTPEPVLVLPQVCISPIFLQSKTAKGCCCGILSTLLIYFLKGAGKRCVRPLYNRLDRLWYCIVPNFRLTDKGVTSSCRGREWEDQALAQSWDLWLSQAICLKERKINALTQSLFPGMFSPTTHVFLFCHHGNEL